MNEASKEKTATAFYHPAESRGLAKMGWLESRHSFSFGSYHNPDRMGFGLLRVLNDDRVQGGMGFGKHPHNNMEIISIPLEGDLEHKDSIGNVALIKKGDIQVMSAGSGIYHSETNPNHEHEVRFLQIWIHPKIQNVEPRYDQKTLNPEDRKNRFQQILSPNQEDEGVWIYQDAWFHLGSFEAGGKETYNLKQTGNGLYVFVLNGRAKCEGFELNTRDGLGLTEISEVEFTFLENTELLLMEVPMSDH